MKIARLRRRAAWGLWVESVVRAVAPAGGIVAAYVVVALFGFGNPYAFAGVLAVAVIALGAGLAWVRWPGGDEIDRRIERVSGLSHRPISMLEDEPENDGPEAAAIWRIHQRRVAVSLERARAGRPMIEAAAWDPWAMRGLLLLLLLVGVVVAGPAAMPRVSGAFGLPSMSSFGPVVDAWVTPPGYSGLPPLVLSPGNRMTVLAGSEVTVVVDGGDHAPPARLAGHGIKFSDLAEKNFRADAVLTRTGRLLVGPWWDRLGAWDFTVVAPAGPVVTLAPPVVVNERLVLGWQATDRFGLASLSAALAPVGHPDAAPEVVALGIAGLDPRQARGVGKLDVADSPYAGLRVAVTATGRNLAGIATTTAPLLVTLPPADLQDRTALALAGLRQQLALQPKAWKAVADRLRGLAEAPLSPISASADLQMAALARAMKTGETSAEDAQGRLGALVQQVEAGPDYEPGKALAAANQALLQALQQALRQGSNSGKLDAGQLQGLLAAMHAALAQHLQALGQAAKGQAGNSIDTDDLDRMAEQIAADEAAGNSAKAAAELQQLKRILSALQSARPMSAAEAARSAAASQAAQTLAGILQGEAALLDQTNEGSALPSQQGALQDQLSDAQAILGQAGMKLPGMGQAGAAMGTAKNALGQQDMVDAAAAESAAIQALQKAAGALAASRQGMSFGEGGQSGAGDDPAGEGVDGAPDEDAMPGIMPSGGDAAEKVEQQIIKDDADPALPQAVHQYYHRLLEPDGN